MNSSITKSSNNPQSNRTRMTQMTRIHTDFKNTMQPRFGLSLATYALLGLLLISVFCLDLSLGSVSIPIRSILTILTGGQPERASWGNIILLFRLPKAITATLAGAGLAVSGLLMQTLFRNPLAGPSVLGISSGASLGVALVVLFAAAGGVSSKFLDGLGVLGDLGLAFAASLGAMVVLLIILIFARRVQHVMTLLILGLLFGYATSALVSILIHFSLAERIQAYISWTFGSFGATTWRQLWIFIPLVLSGLLLTTFVGKPLNALLLGEAYGKSMGLNVRQVRILLIVNIALLSGTVTAFCGPVIFLDVAIPHLCRSVFNTSDHRILLPTVMLIGSSVALIADLVSQGLGSQIVLPLNAVTSLIGVPMIIWFIVRKKNIAETFVS
jgi:iron complex transport system permease protein